MAESSLKKLNTTITHGAFGEDTLDESYGPLNMEHLMAHSVKASRNPNIKGWNT